jgi:hypothetical protein
MHVSAEVISRFVSFIVDDRIGAPIFTGIIEDPTVG